MNTGISLATEREQGIEERSKRVRKRLKIADANIHIREKPERGHDDSKPVTAKCCCALLPFNKVDVLYSNVHFSYGIK